MNKIKHAGLNSNSKNSPHIHHTFALIQNSTDKFGKNNVSRFRVDITKYKAMLNVGMAISKPIV
jgi:hypothetical protein